MDPITTFSLISAIIFIGFFMSKLFKTTSIPDIILLILIGIVLGPILNVIDRELFMGLMPLFGPLTLMIIIFEGGLVFNIRSLSKSLGKASLFTLITFILTASAISGVVFLIFKWTVFESLLMGATLGGTTAVATMCLMKYSKISEEVKDVINLEATINDSLTIISVVMLGQIIVAGSVDPKLIAQSLATSFTTSLVLGAVFGITWFRLLIYFEGWEFSSVLTLAATLLLYASVELLGSNGIIAVFVFGLILGNIESMPFKNINAASIKKRLSESQKELAFFVRTFFFVYIGLLFSFNSLSNSMIITSILIIIGIYLMRRLVAQFFFTNRERNFAAMMMPKGLAAAVLSTYPQYIGLKIAGFTEMVLLIIILSNVVASVGVFLYSNGKKQENSGDEANGAGTTTMKGTD